jgi:hypothetical protein
MSFWITANGVKSVGPFADADEAASTLRAITGPTKVQYVVRSSGFSVIPAAGAEPKYAIAEAI